MTPQTPAALVDVYDDNGAFLCRMDFSGPDAVTTAHTYAESVGKIISSGRSVILADKLAPLTSGRYSTFIPDGMEVGAGRLEATDVNLGTVVVTQSIFIVKKPTGSLRNPGHDQALTKEEIHFGMVIQQYFHDVPEGPAAVVVREPYYVYIENLSRFVWMVDVVTKNDGPHDGQIKIKNWLLSDMGVTPYENAPGKDPWWNQAYYTLARHD